jgi:hypothetical protein
LWVFVPPHFFTPVKRLAFSLSGAKKRQLPRTLYAIAIDILLKINKNRKSKKFNLGRESKE